MKKTNICSAALQNQSYRQYYYIITYRDMCKLITTEIIVFVAVINTQYTVTLWILDPELTLNEMNKTLYTGWTFMEMQTADATCAGSSIK